MIVYLQPERNVYEVSEEFAFHNRHSRTREDVVFLLNGIPVQGINPIRRYHSETPEMFVPQQLFSVTDAIEGSDEVSWHTQPRNILRWKLTESGFSNPLIGGKGGQECLPSFGSSFFNPHDAIEKTKHHLPHWQQGETWIFVTWRLGDSLPKTKLDPWKAEREAWMRHHPEPWDEKTETEFHDRFSRQIDDWLDQGSGSCVLKDPACAKIVADALRHFDGERYELASFVVMPNHVHVLFRPLRGRGLAVIVKSWKGFTARAINQRISRTGALWQDEYWDRLIRSERHFFKVAEYIRENPAKANLLNGQFILEDRFSMES